MTWREHCRPIIANVLADNEDKLEKEIRKALKEAYPYGMRKYHPYKIWCDEIRVQRGLKPIKTIKTLLNFVDENQTNLFE